MKSHKTLGDWRLNSFLLLWVVFVGILFFHSFTSSTHILKSEDPRVSLVKVSGNNYPGAKGDKIPTGVVKFCDGDNLIYKSDTGIATLYRSVECVK